MWQAVRASLETDLPEEPDPECIQPVSTLRFRIPGGETFSRNFLASTTLQVCFALLDTHDMGWVHGRGDAAEVMWGGYWLYGEGWLVSLML